MSEPKVRVAPVARRMAEEAGLELASLTGTGPGGRIVRADVEAALLTEEAAPSPSQAASSASGAATLVRPTRAQTVIARRMSAAKANVPEFTVAREVDAGPLLALRERLRAAEPPLPSLNDIVVKAAALALREHPGLNASYRDEGFALHERVNVGVAVAGEGSLLVPTVFDADRLSLRELATETRRLAGKARDGSIGPEDLEGGTFTVSNLGGFGATRFTAVINEPQAAILAVGAALPRALVSDTGELVAGHLLELTLTADHRLVYGADAARFLATLAELLEAPDRLDA